jgi:hypothetical protein
VAKTIFKILLQVESLGKGQALVEAGYKLSSDPPTWVQPDVSFLLNTRVQATAGKEYFEGAPELAVEVVSPSESAHDLNEKIHLLLRGGSLAVGDLCGRTTDRSPPPGWNSKDLEARRLRSVPCGRLVRAGSLSV